MALPPPPRHTRRPFIGETRARRKAPPFAVRGKTKKGIPAWWFASPIVPIFGGIGMALLFFVTVAAAGVGGAAGTYAYFTHDLPEFNPNTLPQFETSRIYDRYGNLLQEIADPKAGNRFEVPLNGISPDLINATVAAEDKTFWTNPGIDPQALGRAVRNTFIDTSYGSSGASTITMQVVKQAFPERYETPTREDKVRQVFIAYSLSQKYSKEDLMTFYLNSIFYGNRSYGIQAAAKNYFGVNAKDLKLWQSSFLAGLPQLPSRYDPTVSPANLARARIRQQYVLSQMVAQGYITQPQADDAYAQSADPSKYGKFKADTPSGAPHFVNYVRQYVEDRYGPDALYRGGLRIYTTIDLDVQRLAEDVVKSGVTRESKAGYDVSNGALVAVVPWSGQILCMVGSTDFYDQTKTPDGKFNVAGEYNVATNPRQPGSSIKPIVYALALEKGWYPSYTILDYHQTWDDGTDKGYTPNNFNLLHNGAVAVRDALQQSLNLPALKAMEFNYTKDGSKYGKVQGLQNFTDFAHDMGLADSFRQPERYGLGISLALGGGEASVLQLTNAYATMANGGMYVEASPIIRIEKSDGTPYLDPKTGKTVDNSKTRPVGPQVMDRGNAYLMTSILTDNKARTPIFGASSPLILRDRPVAAKTGTTNDFRDGWTVGYSTQIAVGMWVGNNDNHPMKDVDGVETAAPIWNEFMRLIHGYEKAPQLLVGPDGNLPAKEFERPANVVDGYSCTTTGHKPTYPNSGTKDLFVKGKEPKLACGELDEREQIELIQAWSDLTKDPNLLKQGFNGGGPLETKKTEYGKYTGAGATRLNAYYTAVDAKYRPKNSRAYILPTAVRVATAVPSTTAETTPEAVSTTVRVTQAAPPSGANLLTPASAPNPPPPPVPTKGPPPQQAGGLPTPVYVPPAAKPPTTKP